MNLLSRLKDALVEPQPLEVETSNKPIGVAVIVEDSPLEIFPSEEPNDKTS